MEKCGVLLPVFSLPSRYGIGTLGTEAFGFIDFLKAAHQDFWQVLPLCPTSYGDSPYQSTSAFAGNPNLIDITELIKRGYVTEDEAEALDEPNTGRVNYLKCYVERKRLLRTAYGRFAAAPPPADYLRFNESQAGWLDNFALFMALKDEFDQKSWEHWPQPYRRPDSDEVKEFAEGHEAELGFYRFTQYEFDCQWKEVKKYAARKGVKIIGDMPIYVAYDSADVWAEPQLFLLNDELKCTLVAGVPPDAFTEDGQLWGNPIYDWEFMKKDGYQWWEKRLKKCSELYDLVRIDHFRGFESYYAVEAGRENAKVGEWKKGPGGELFKIIGERLKDLNIIAEDLGYLDDDVRNMVASTGYPSMKVLQFGLDGNPDNEYLPENFTENCIAYTGTHDNDTSRGFYESLGKGQRRTARKALRCGIFQNFVDVMIKSLLKSRAKYVVIPLQDYLDEGSDSRVNIPSTVGGINWKYRLKKMPDDKTASRMARLAEKYRKPAAR